MSCPRAENVTCGICDVTPRDARRKQKKIFLLRKMTKIDQIRVSLPVRNYWQLRLWFRRDD